MITQETISPIVPLVLKQINTEPFREYQSSVVFNLRRGASIRQSVALGLYQDLSTLESFLLNQRSPVSDKEWGLIIKTYTHPLNTLRLTESWQISQSYGHLASTIGEIGNPGQVDRDSLRSIRSMIEPLASSLEEDQTGITTVCLEAQTMELFSHLYPAEFSNDYEAAQQLVTLAGKRYETLFQKAEPTIRDYQQLKLYTVSHNLLQRKMRLEAVAKKREAERLKKR